jgi:hypothetical protein
MISLANKENRRNTDHELYEAKLAVKGCQIEIDFGEL